MTVKTQGIQNVFPPPTCPDPASLPPLPTRKPTQRCFSVPERINHGFAIILFTSICNFAR